MSTTTHSVENDCESIDHDRYVRACSEEMSVEMLAPNMALVTHDDSEYTVDLLDGVGECPDHQYRETICKHIIKAALFAFYTEGVKTPIVARVVRHANDNPCPADNHRICDGPVGPKLPCPDCVRATTVDEWTVWQQTAGRTGEHR